MNGIRIGYKKRASRWAWGDESAMIFWIWCWGALKRSRVKAETARDFCFLSSLLSAVCKVHTAQSTAHMTHERGTRLCVAAHMRHGVGEVFILHRYTHGAVLTVTPLHTGATYSPDLPAYVAARSILGRPRATACARRSRRSSERRRPAWSKAVAIGDFGTARRLHGSAPGAPA